MSFFCIWFGFLCAQVSSGNSETMKSSTICNFTQKPRSHVRILIYRAWAIQSTFNCCKDNLSSATKETRYLVR